MRIYFRIGASGDSIIIQFAHAHSIRAYNNDIKKSFKCRLFRALSPLWQWAVASTVSPVRRFAAVCDVRCTLRRARHHVRLARCENSNIRSRVRQFYQGDICIYKVEKWECKYGVTHYVCSLMRSRYRMFVDVRLRELWQLLWTNILCKCVLYCWMYSDIV